MQTQSTNAHAYLCRTTQFNKLIYQDWFNFTKKTCITCLFCDQCHVFFSQNVAFQLVFCRIHTFNTDSLWWALHHDKHGDESWQNNPQYLWVLRRRRLMIPFQRHRGGGSFLHNIYNDHMNFMRVMKRIEFPQQCRQSNIKISNRN